MKIFTVNITEYEDDYKHRYGSGVYTKPIKLFKNKKDAQQYIKNYILDYLNENDINYFNEEEIKLVNDDITTEAKIRQKYIDKSYKEILEIYQSKCKGEYVDYLLDFRIEKHELSN
jgi:hypothetical protein